MERTKKEAGGGGKKPRRPRKRAPSAAKEEESIRDVASERERRWFEENRSLDSLALFAKYYQRL